MEALGVKERTENIVASWLVEAKGAGADVGEWEFETYRRKAVAAATLLHSDGTAFLAAEPGNGTAYDVVLSLLRGDVRALSAHRLGGDLVVSLPHFGVCWTMQSTALHVPAYIGEKARLNDADAVVLACLLSLVSAYLEMLT